MHIAWWHHGGGRLRIGCACCITSETTLFIWSSAYVCWTQPFGSLSFLIEAAAWVACIAIKRVAIYYLNTEAVCLRHAIYPWIHLFSQSVHIYTYIHIYIYIYIYINWYIIYVYR